MPAQEFVTFADDIRIMASTVRLGVEATPSANRQKIGPLKIHGKYDNPLSLVDPNDNTGIGFLSYINTQS